MRISVDSKNLESWTPKEHNILYTKFKLNKFTSGVLFFFYLHVYMVMNFITWMELQLGDF